MTLRNCVIACNLSYLSVVELVVFFISFYGLFRSRLNGRLAFLITVK